MAHTAFTTSRSRSREYPRPTVLGGYSMAGPSRPRRHSHDRPHSVPSWIDELPREYPHPPPERPAPPPRTYFGQARQGTSVTPSNSISQLDRQSARSFREGRTTFPRGEMLRGTSGIMRPPESYSLNRRDVPRYDQRPSGFYPTNYPQLTPSGPEMRPMVNNYITTNNRQTYNIDSSRHQRVDARGQRNTQNIRVHSVTNNRRDTVDESRTSQRLSASSGRQYHRKSRHHREYRG